jgi:glycosyltransferase involved in cell wall biosynthesis
MNPKVSVIIPTYNRANLLPRAIKSVLNQTFRDFELIIVDDGSTDNTRELVERFQKKDSRIKYFYKENGGPGSARNFGVKNARGNFVIFLDSDDMFLSGLLEEEIKYTNEFKIIMCGAWVVNLENNKIINYIVGHTDCCLFEKTLFEKFGYYDEERNFSEDVGLGVKWTVAEYLNKSFIPKKVIDKPLVIIFKHKEPHFTDNLNHLIITAKSMVDKYSDAIYVCPHIFSNVFLHLGHYEILAHNIREGRKYFLKSFSLKKNNFIALFLYILTFLGQVMYLKIFNLADWIRKNIFWKIKVARKKKEFLNFYDEAIKLLKFDVTS